MDESIGSMQMPDVLYHGSPAAFRTFDLSKAYPLKDYGRGFYLTSCLEQAVSWANKKRRKAACGYVYEYQVVSWENIREILHIKEFLKYDLEWAVFVARHRCMELLDNFDLVYNRMADSASEKIERASQKYLMKGNYKNQKHLLRILSRQKEGYDQYCFKTDCSHQYLVCKRVAVVSGSVEEPVITWQEAKDFYKQHGLRKKIAVISGNRITWEEVWDFDE